MTPQHRPRHTAAIHLTSEQMSDLLTSTLGSQPGRRRDGSRESLPGVEAELHLDACAACAAEFAGLREALSLFREASRAHADREFERAQRIGVPMLPARRLYPQTLVWVSACAILMAGLLPIEMRWQRTARTAPAVHASASPRPAESDEALLEDINREISASVPAPMQALADPAAGSSSGEARSAANSSSSSTQGKD